MRKKSSMRANKIEDLKLLKSIITEIKSDNKDDVDLIDLIDRLSREIDGKIRNERVNEGLFVVSQIINDCSGNTVFEGTKTECVNYVKAERGKNPMKEFIITQA